MVETKKSLDAKTVKELRKLCVARGIKGMSKKRKDDVIKALLANNKKGKGETASVAKPTKSAAKGGVQKTTGAGGERLTSLQFTMTSIETDRSAKKGNKFTTTIRIQNGASHGEFGVVGRKVSEVKVILKEVLNIDQFAQAMVNGKLVDDSYVIKEKDSIEFIKPAGSKG